MLPTRLFLSSRRRHTRSKRDWSSDVCSSDLHITFTDPWGISDLRSALATTASYLDTISHNVHRLVDVSGSRRIPPGILPQLRSEERRVGKECRARGATRRDQQEKTSKDGPVS